MQKRLKEILDELAQIETRAAEIRDGSEKAEADALASMAEELGDMEARKAALLAEKAKLEEQAAEVKSVAEGAVEAREIELDKGKEKQKMTIDEVRNSKRYIDAFAEYIKTGDDSECRAVLTENVTVEGTAGVPIPTFVENRIMTAWDNDEIMSRVRRTFVKGNYKVGFELSAGPAVVHVEGANAPQEETLTLGAVELVPETLKKWITTSDEVMDMKGQAFLDYLFDEIEYRIVKLAADKVITDIAGSPTAATVSAPAVANLTVTAAGAADFINAEALLSDEARNNVIIVNKATYAAYRALQLSASYAIDPFDGMTVLFNNTLKPIGSATSGEAVAIVGDLGSGYLTNFPNDYQPTFKYDDLSLSEKDLVKIVGRLPMAHAVVASGRFTVIKKGA